MPFSDVIQHHMYMALENRLHFSWSVTIKTLKIRLRSLQIQTVQRQMSLKQERALVCLYKVKSDDNFDSLRLQRYQQRSAEEQHLWNQRFFHPPQEQPYIIVWESTCKYVQQWMGNPSQLQPTEWAWYEKGGRYFAVLTDKAAAPPNLLKIIRCNCKTGCNSKQCTCCVCTNVHGEAERDTDF